MATSNAKLEGMAPNSVEKREITWKQGQCQMCLSKVPTSKQKKLENDLDAGTVKVSKADADHSHYCPDCAAERKQMKLRWLERRESGGGSSSRSKARGKGKAKGKSKPKGKAKKAPAKKGKAKAKKAPAKKGRKKKSGSGDPF